MAKYVALRREISLCVDNKVAMEPRRTAFQNHGLPLAPPGASRHMRSGCGGIRLFTPRRKPKEAMRAPPPVEDGIKTSDEALLGVSLGALRAPTPP